MFNMETSISKNLGWKKHKMLLNEMIRGLTFGRVGWDASTQKINTKNWKENNDYYNLTKNGK